MFTYDRLSIGRPRGFVWSLVFALGLIVANSQRVWSTDSTSYVAVTPEEGSFALATAGKATPLYVNASDHRGVIRAVEDLQTDIERVTQTQPQLFTSESAPNAERMVLVGTLGSSPEIDRLVEQNKLDVSAIAGKWEAFLLQVVENPRPGIEQALVIVGSDKRGTIFGVYDLSEQIGVSPWYWWADVPVKQQSSLYILPGKHSRGEPKVKYRGIFINDEAPALAGWATEKFGGFNHRFYEKVFELILRMKGNYLWPAMWGRAFYVDDTLNPQLADEYGIVIGTSHHEPLMRAHVEWEKFGTDPWNYKTNADTLRAFWRKGIQRMGDNESIVTIGMRGDGDEPMSEGTEIALLEKIVDDQRKIIRDVTGKPLEETPQMWALYKEVQDYYDKGMRVPDDVTLLLCDDNWGNIRKLPELEDSLRDGGYGIYYHFDYVGGPRNYKWLNTTQISRVWEQMHLAYEYHADRVWIVNVGDIKPMEFPISFFLDYAWNPDRWPAERLPEYTRLWAAQQFGSEHAEAIADMLTAYTKYNSRRKPELLSADTYSLVHYQEAESVVEDYRELQHKAEQIYEEIPAEYKDAYYQLVLFPVQACANLNELYVTVAKNHLYAKQGRAATNAMAEKAQRLFEKDAALTRYYNEKLADGKWSHMMDQTHIGYTYWQQPEHNNMPEVEKIDMPATAQMGVMVQGDESWWPDPNTRKALELPVFDRYQQQTYYIEIFNQGKQPFSYTAASSEPWLKISSRTGQVDQQERLWVSVDWQKAPSGKTRVPITITGPDKKKVTIQAVIHNPKEPAPAQVEGFVEGNGYVSMEAAHYSKVVGKGNISWQRIPNLGRTLSAMTPQPVTAREQTPGSDSPHLEYKVYLFDSGQVQVKAYLSPTLNFHNDQGLRYAVSFDNEPPQIINMHEDESLQAWESHVSNNINIKTSTHTIKKAGEHVLKFWMVDPGVVLQKLVVETEDMAPSYLGPPESYRHFENAGR